MVVKARKRKKVQRFQCPNLRCNSYHTVRHGWNVTKEGKFARRKCQDCGTTFYEKNSKKEINEG